MSHPLHFQWEFPIADDRQQERIERVIDNLQAGMSSRANEIQRLSEAKKLLRQLSDYTDILNRYHPASNTSSLQLTTEPVTFSYHYFNDKKEELEAILKARYSTYIFCNCGV